MWFVGLIVGAVLGAVIGFMRDVETAIVIGAVAGLFIGLAFRKTRAVVDEKWKRDVEEALKELNRRTQALAAAQGTSSNAQPAAQADAQAEAAVSPAPATPHVEPLPEAAAPGEPVPPPASVPQSTVAVPPRPAQPSALWNFFFGGNTLVRFGDRISANFSAASGISGWFPAGLTYASYNVLGAVVILPVLRHLRSNRDAAVAGLLAGPVAMIPAFFFFACMIGWYPATTSTLGSRMARRR